MKPKSFKSAILGLTILFPAVIIICAMFNALIHLACKTLLYMMQNPFTVIVITLGIMSLGFILNKLLKGKF
jgi:hypothetical protein